MRPETQPTASKATLWTGRVLSTLAVLFLLLDGTMKVGKAAPVLETTGPLQIPERVIPALGVVLLASTLLHAIPRTAALGAILLTGYLGGATWTHVRLGGPAFLMVFPGLFGTILWLGLYLRDPRVRALVPVRRR